VKAVKMKEKTFERDMKNFKKFIASKWYMKIIDEVVKAFHKGRLLARIAAEEVEVEILGCLRE
jgi:hypothetical protein